MLVLISLLLILSQSPDKLSKELEMNYLEANRKYAEALELAKELYSETGELVYLKKITILEFLRGNEERGVEYGLKYLESAVDPEIFFLLVNTLEKTGKLLLLKEKLDTHAEKDSIDLYRAFLHYKFGEFGEAYKYMSKHISDVKENVVFTSSYFDILWRLGKKEELYDFLEQVPDLSSELTYLKALYFRLLDNTQKAAEKFDKLYREYNYRDFGFLKLYMNFLEEIGNIPRADSVAELMVSLNPFNGEAYKSVGIYYYKVGNYTASFISLLVANGLTEGDSEIHYYLARVLVALGSYYDALSEIDKALKFLPDSKDYRYYRIYVLLNIDSVGLAMREVYSLQTEDPQESYFYYIKAQCLDKIGDHKGASKNLKEALIRDSLNLKRYWDLLSHAKNRNINIDVDFYLRKALKVSRNASDSVNVSYLALELDKYNIAIEILENFASRDSVPPELLNNLAYALCEANKDMERALNYVNRALDAQPDNYIYLDTKAWILYKLGRSEEAKYYIQRALELGGEKEEEIRYHWEVINEKK